MGNPGKAVRGCALVVWLMLWLTPGQVRAQSSTTGAIQGVITDAATGEALAGVTIVVSSQGSSAQSALTDGRGAYKITDLAPGDYLVTFYYLDLTVERPVSVGVQKVTAVFHKLDTAAVKGEVVKVQATAPTIDPTSTAQGITIDKNYLKNIPVPGRSFESALGAAPGSQGDVLGVAFSGSTSLENQYVVDGVNTTGLTYGTVGSPVINDFIEEIEIITGGYNAEYGRATGGIVNVVTKSGSNELKGSVFAYYQPGQLTAAAERTPQNATSLDVKGDVGYRADFGVEIGGPIVKDRLWFFVGLAPQFARTDYLRETKRQSDCRMLQADGKLSTCDPKLASQGGFADGKPDVDPETGFFITDPVDHETRNATGKALNALGKINFAASPQQQGQLAVQLVPQRGRSPNLFGPAEIGTTSKSLTTDVSAKWTSKLADDKTEIEALLGVHRDGYANTAIDGTKNSVPLQVLINGSLGTWGPGFGETATTNEKCFDSIPNSADPYPFITNCPMNTRAYYVGGPGSLYKDTEQRVSGRLGVTQRLKAGGSHEIKGGIDLESNTIETTRALSGGSFVQNQLGTQVDVVRWVQLANPDETRTRFDNTCTTPPPASMPGAPMVYACDYLDGKPGADGTLIPGNTFNWALYLRDSWQIRPNLTLNVGLRYEEQRLRFAEFLRGQVDPITGERHGKNAVKLTGELAPRLGILYDWTREGRSKAYAHWGRFYESIPLEINNYNYGQPVQYLQSYSPSKCGMSDPRIGGPDGVGCTDTAEAADVRQELFGTNGSLTAPGLKGQYIDEIVGGFEYELFDDFKLGISYQNRNFGRVIEDVSTDNARTYVVANPGEWSASEEKAFQARIDRTDDPEKKARLETQLRAFQGIRIFDKPRRDYNALQFTTTRRFGKQLYIQASYTLSRTAGNYPGLISYDDNIILPNNSTQYDLIELLANKIGPLPQDRPHYIKIDGYYTFDLKQAGDATVGIRFRALSGAPENALAAHYLYGSNQSFLLPRGSIGRADFEHGLDIHLGYGRKLGKGMHGEVFLDLYNVYNNQGVASVDNTYATFVKQGATGAGSSTLQAANPVVGGTFEDLIWVKTVDIRGNESPVPIGRNPNFLNTASRYAPMYARIGARVTF
ncbi:MAG: TonB-dependent receptor [Myxococcales bacterium]|nr:TonB-dependent receptor [Myxococcales bacterium]